MSQYPSPYSPPPYPQNAGYFKPYAFDPLRPAKRAGVLMIIVGAIAILFSTCMVGIAQMLRTGTVPPEAAAQVQQLESQGITPERLLATGVVYIFLAVIQIAFGVFVRKSKTFAIVFSLTGTAILLGLFAFGSAVAVLTNASPQILGGLVPLGVMIWQLMWLIAAFRARRHVAFAQQQYQAQYWQYQQNMQGYGGYGQAPPPPPPLPQKPPENAGNSD